MTHHTFRDSLDAILLACGGWFLFCVSDAMAKYLTVQYHPFEILAFSGTIGVLLSGAWILRKHGWAGFMTPKWRWYIGRGITQTGSSFLVIKALALIPLADFYGIIFMTPMVITILAAIFLKEKIGFYRIGAILLGFIGVLIIAGPSFNSGNIGYLYALIAVGFTSTSGIFVRKIGRDKIVTRYAFFPFLICASLFLPLTIFHDFKMPAGTLDLSLLMLFAPIMLLGLVGYSSGLSRARETAMIAPFHYTQLIWGSLFGFVIFHEVPAFTTFVGSLLIIAAGLLVIWREHRHHRKIVINAIKAPL